MSSTTIQSRISFGKTKHLAETPDLLDIQLESFQDFFQLETTPDKRNNEVCLKYSRKFSDYGYQEHFRFGIDYFIDPPRYTIDECMERGLTSLFH